MPTVRLLKGRGMNPHFYSLHVASDNITRGHGAVAKDTVKLFLEEKRKEGGDRSVQDNWKRIWNGYVGWATSGFNPAGLAERRLVVDGKSLNVGSPEDPESFPDGKKHREERMADLIRRKAPYASRLDERVFLGGDPVGRLFLTSSAWSHSERDRSTGPAGPATCQYQPE